MDAKSMTVCGGRTNSREREGVTFQMEKFIMEIGKRMSGKERAQ